MSWFNNLLGWIFRYPDGVLVFVWLLYTGWDLMIRVIIEEKIDHRLAAINLFFGVLFSAALYYWLLPKIVLGGEWKKGLVNLIGFAAVLILFKFQLRFSEWFWNVEYRQSWLEISRMVNFQFVTFLIWILLVYYLMQQDNHRKKASLDELDFYHKSMQLGPHFVMNMMVDISERAKGLSRELSEEIEQFSTVLKYGYKDIRSENTLMDEIQAIIAYEYCQRSRFGNSMNHRLSINISEETASQLPIPKMTLLTLYADVFKHGDYTGDFPGTVGISLTECPLTRNTLLVLTVYNLLGGQNSPNGTGFGLKSVVSVLSYYFGEDFQLHQKKNGDEFSLLLMINYG
jgi:hypothetical protein